MIYPKKSSNIARTNSSEKQPSLLSILILTTLTIALYNFAIYQSGKTVTGIVEVVVKKAVRDY